MINLFPIAAVGGLFFVLSRSRRRSYSNKEQKALPSPENRGELFVGENPPDIIIGNPGYRFSVVMKENPASGYRWKLAASPPDNSISVDSVFTHFSESGVDKFFVFDAVSTGDGALVFHEQHPELEGSSHPRSIVEIQTKIS